MSERVGHIAIPTGFQDTRVIINQNPNFVVATFGGGPQSSLANAMQEIIDLADVIPPEDRILHLRGDLVHHKYEAILLAVAGIDVGFSIVSHFPAGWSDEQLIQELSGIALEAFGDARRDA
ncbi:MAG: hypothetical protein ACW99U_12685 [Candidatus Thorarchaeota archaeon]|jgi:hypothetical protein